MWSQAVNRLKLSKSKATGGGGAVDGNGVFYTDRGMEGFEKTPSSFVPPPAAEEDENAKKTNIRSMLVSFSEHTSLHGVSRVGSSDRHVAVRIFWFLLVLTAAGWAGYNVSEVIINFMSYPVSTVVSVEYEENIPFPAVTICNLNQMRETQFTISICSLIYSKKDCDEWYPPETTSSPGNTPENNSTSTTSTTPTTSTTSTTSGTSTTPTNSTTSTTSTTSATSATSSTSATYAMSAPWTDPSTTTTPFEGSADWGSGSGDYGYNYDPYYLEMEEEAQVRQLLDSYDTEQRHKVGHSMQKMLVDCKYQRAHLCNHRNFTRFWNHKYGNCYTFNKNLTANVVSKPGPVHGLSLLLNAEAEEYLQQSQVVGFKIVVHPHDAMPFPEDEGLIVSPGFATSIAVSKLDIRRTEAPYGRCYNYNKEENRAVNMYAHEFDVSYTDKACQRSCYQQAVVDKCGCCDGDYPCDTGGAADGTSISYCNVSKGHPAVQCLEQLRQDFNHGEFGCGGVCLPACHETTFQTEVSMGVWPSSASVNKLERDLQKLPKEIYYDWEYVSQEHLRDNVAKVDIYFKQLNYEKITAYPAYDWSRVLGDLGGQLGLWLGFSLMTAVELLELVLGIARYLIMKMLCPRSAPRVNTINVAQYRR